MNRSEKQGVQYVVTRGADDVVRASVQEGLDPRTDIVNHSPTGFEYGYGGSGPAQLAIGILADYFERVARRTFPEWTADLRAEVVRRLAIRWHQRFKFHAIATADRSVMTWSLSAADVDEYLDRVGFLGIAEFADARKMVAEEIAIEAGE